MKNVQAVFQLETTLAKASRKLDDLRDPYANYHKMALPALQQLAGSVDWSAVYLPGIGIKTIDSAIVGQPEFFTALNAALTATPVSVWRKTTCAFT